MAYEKKVVSGGSEKLNRKEFKVKKEKSKEEDCLLIFDSDVEYVVEKLSIDDLPPTIDEQPITWFVNFSIKDTNGNYVNGVLYSLLFPPLPAKTRLVIFDGTNAVYFTGPITDRAHGNKQWKEVRLNIGDPGGGGTPGT